MDERQWVDLTLDEVRGSTPPEIKDDTEEESQLGQLDQHSHNQATQEPVE